MGMPPRYLSMDRLRRYLQALPERRGLPLSILFSKADDAIVREHAMAGA
jgi:hypothetical protein